MNFAYSKRTMEQMSESWGDGEFRTAVGRGIVSSRRKGQSIGQVTVFEQMEMTLKGWEKILEREEKNGKTGNYVNKKNHVLLLFRFVQIFYTIM